MLSIVIITRNTKELLEGLLDSIQEDSSIAPELKETIVVDNGSTDGTDAMIRNKFAETIVIRNEANMGFAAAVNKGYQSSSGDFVLLLNSDTRLIPGEILKLLSFVKGDERIGIAGPQLVYEDLSPQRSFAPIPSLVQELIPRFVLEALFPDRFKTKGMGVRGSLDVASLIGAGILVRRKLLDMLNGFDEEFFFFLEETDLCVRAKQSGFRVVFYPESKLVHFQGKTVGKVWIPGRIEYAISLYKFIKRYHSQSYYRLFTAIRFIKALLFLICAAFPALLLSDRSIQKKYRYYAMFFVWHLRGCPDNAGLRTSSPE